MSIHEMYDQNASFGQVMDIAEKNCAECMGKGCRNVNCPNIRALMNQSEKKLMTTDDKRRYFEIMRS